MDALYRVRVHMERIVLLRMVVFADRLRWVFASRRPAVRSDQRSMAVESDVKLTAQARSCWWMEWRRDKPENWAGDGDRRLVRGGARAGPIAAGGQRSLEHQDEGGRVET